MSHNSSVNSGTDVDPSRREPVVWALTLVQFFVGGFVLFVVATMLMAMFAPADAEYDGIMSILSVGITGVVIALPSMMVAMAIGVPVRLVPALRSRWLANGEVTVAGAAAGLLVCAVAITAMGANVVEGEVRSGSDVMIWALAIGWAIFAISVAHFVWPARWKRTKTGR